MDFNAELQELLKLAGMGGEAVTPENVRVALDKLKQLIQQLGQQRHVSQSAAAGGGSAPGQGSHSRAATDIGGLSGQAMGASGRRVLVVGQLGIVIHQLRQTLNKLGAEVDVAHDVNEAINMYQKDDYSTVILDLFMPTEREGLMVLDEIKRLGLVLGISTTIVVMATPSKDKNLRDLCKSHGAAVFLHKAEGWHKKVIELFSNPDAVTDDED